MSTLRVELTPLWPLHNQDMAKILPPSQRQTTLAKAKADLAVKSEAALAEATNDADQDARQT